MPPGAATELTVWPVFKVQVYPSHESESVAAGQDFSLAACQRVRTLWAAAY
jgi:hypothetical protein